ncbi:MAG: hypothetical protein Kow00103_10400 [Candidatus Caldatribacteriota bacterium]
MDKSLIDLIIDLKRNCLADEQQIRTICNISLAEYKGITEMDIEEQIPCNVLAKKMGLSPSRGSRVIDNLVRKGYLLRKTHPRDRRSFIVSLSSKGIKIKKRIERERSNCESRIKKSLTDQEIELIKESLELITKIFNQNSLDI